MIKYDKLKNMDTEEIFFDFKCPYCKVDGKLKGNWKLTPIGISWKPDHVNNSNIRNEQGRKLYDSLPIFREAIMKAQNQVIKGTRISIHCLKCNNSIIPIGKIDSMDVKKWCNNNLDYFMDLRPKVNNNGESTKSSRLPGLFRSGD